MTVNVFDSSDSIRTAQPLRHVHTVRFDGPMALEKGDALPGVTVAYETYGTLSAARDNAVLICHAISGDSHVARHDENDDPGWWELLVGSGKPIDTDRFFVICPNVLGGCRGDVRAVGHQPFDRQAVWRGFSAGDSERHGGCAAAADGPTWALRGCWPSWADRWGGHQALAWGGRDMRRAWRGWWRWRRRRD